MNALMLASVARLSGVELEAKRGGLVCKGSVPEWLYKMLDTTKPDLLEWIEEGRTTKKGGKHFAVLVASKILRRKVWLCSTPTNLQQMEKDFPHILCLTAEQVEEYGPKKLKKKFARTEAPKDYAKRASSAARSAFVSGSKISERLRKGGQ